MRLLRVVAAVVPLSALLAGCAKAPDTPLEPLPTGPPPTTAQKQVAKAAGKSTDDLSGNEIMVQAGKALRQARSVRVVGYIAFDGNLVALDLRYKGPQAGMGFVKINGNQIDLIRLGTTAYLRADEDFLRAAGEPAAEARQLAGKYLKFQIPKNRTGGLAGFTDLARMLGPTFDAGGLVIKGTHKVIRGVRTVSLAAPHESGDTLYVSVAGPPYPMQIVPRGRSADYSLNFVDYGRPITIAAPPAALVVNVPVEPGG